MLLPQSSAFAALKNRLNSVSAIGYLHIAPRTYVQALTVSDFPLSRHDNVIAEIPTIQFHSRQNCFLDISHVFPPSYSTPATAAAPNYDRPNRLKGRDEGIKWSELLEKFRSVQEKSRRTRRIGAEFDDSLSFSEGRLADGVDVRAFNDVVKLQGPTLPAKDIQPVPPASQLQPQKQKSGLAKFGRLGGAVSGSRPKR